MVECPWCAFIVDEDHYNYHTSLSETYIQYSRTKNSVFFFFLLTKNLSFKEKSLCFKNKMLKTISALTNLAACLQDTYSQTLSVTQNSFSGPCQSFYYKRGPIGLLVCYQRNIMTACCVQDIQPECF